jgi:hypothetical protein
VFEPHLPVRTRDGDIAKALYVTLVHLSDAGAIRLLQVQDSPSRRYGPAGYTHVRTGRRRAPQWDRQSPGWAAKGTDL